MSAKTFNTRFQLKYDTYTNWMNEKNQFTLLEGEIAIAYVPESTGADGVLHEPAVLFKVGDGSHSFDELPFVSALAGDVPSWAKVTHIGSGDDRTKIEDNAFIKALEDIEALKLFFNGSSGDGETINVLDKLEALEKTLGTHTTDIGSLIDLINEIQDNLSEVRDDYLSSKDKEELQDSISDIGDTATAAKNRIDTFLDTQGVADVVDTLHDIKTWMEGPGVDTTELTTAIAKETEAREDAINSIEDDLSNIVENLMPELDGSLKKYADDAEADANKYTDEKIEELENSLILDIDDLNQREEYIIFNCGSATVLVSDPEAVNVPPTTTE